MNTKFCINCGNEIPKDSVFCPKCGAGIKNPIVEETKDLKEKKKRINLNKINNTSPSILSRYKIDKTVIVAASSGIGVALLGGYIWSLISIGTGYEIGYMATGLGILCGLAVYLSSGQRKGTPFLQIALVSSLFGIVMGKFFMAHYYLHELVIEEYGSYLASQISPYSWFYIKYAFMSIPDLFSGYDVLWGILAILGVVRVLKNNEGE